MLTPKVLRGFESRSLYFLNSHRFNSLRIFFWIKSILNASPYYESLRETPLIANTIAIKKLFGMNRIISDTSEYSCYLFDHPCKPILVDFFKNVNKDLIGEKLTNHIK